MKRAVFTLWLLLAAVAATAQGNSPDFEFEYSDLQLSPDDYIGLQQLRESGKLQELSEQWFGMDATVDPRG